MDGLHTIVVPLLSGAIGALIGTFGGVYLSFIRQERTKKESRRMAIKAIEILKKYSKKNGTFDQAEQEFNNSVSLSEKRTILVALHKLGIPIIIQPDACFAIDSVCFDKVRIDRDELTAIGNQIEKGQCDHFSSSILIHISTIVYVLRHFVLWRRDGLQKFFVIVRVRIASFITQRIGF